MGKHGRHVASVGDCANLRTGNGSLGKRGSWRDVRSSRGRRLPCRRVSVGIKHDEPIARAGELGEAHLIVSDVGERRANSLRGEVVVSCGCHSSGYTDRLTSDSGAMVTGRRER